MRVLPIKTINLFINITEKNFGINNYYCYRLYLNLFNEYIGFNPIDGVFMIKENSKQAKKIQNI